MRTDRARGLAQGERLGEMAEMQMADVEDVFFVRRVGRVCPEMRGESRACHIRVLKLPSDTLTKSHIRHSLRSVTYLFPL